LILSLPSAVHFNVIQVLCLVWLFLPAGRSLPLLKLLVSESVRIVDLHNWLHSNLSNQILKLIFNLWLLLLQILGLKHVMTFGNNSFYFGIHVLACMGANSPWFERLLKTFLIQIAHEFYFFNI
jgi:hypothetical protein